MFWKKRDERANEELDLLGKSVLWSAAASDEEVDRAANAPYLFARIAARIDEQQRQRDEVAGGWFVALIEAKRALIVLALVSIVAMSTFWLSGGNRSNQPPADATNTASGRQEPVSACALSSAEECAISNDDVLATMFAEGQGGENK